jgi:hypothetical protein
MFDVFIALAFDFVHDGKVTPFDNGVPIPWHHKI